MCRNNKREDILYIKYDALTQQTRKNLTYTSITTYFFEVSNFRM